MFGLSLGHLLILAVVVLLFGSRRLPEVGSALGRGLNAFKKGLSGEEDLDVSLGHKENPVVKNPDAILPKDDNQKS